MALDCRDAAGQYLRPFGYAALALPKAGIKPLVLLGPRGKRLTPIGKLSDLFRPAAVPMPATSRDRTANISGQASNDLDASLGLDLLGSVIGAVGGSPLGIKAAYKRASTVKFEFGDVFETRVEVIDLDRFLATATVDPAVGPFLGELIAEDQVYVIISTVDALSISVDASASGGASLGLDVPAVQSLAGAKVAVSGNAAAASVLTYTSTEAPLVFGVQLVRLFFSGGRFETLKLVKAGAVSVATAGIANEGGSDDDTAIILPAEDIVF